MTAADMTPAADRQNFASALDAPIRWTRFADEFTRRKSEHQASLRGLIPLLRDTRAATKAALPWIKLATFGDVRTKKGSLRHDGNMLEIYGIEGDYDGELITMDRARQVVAQAGLAAILYTSPSHTPEKPRWRILCPCSQSMPVSDRARLLARVNGLFVGAMSNESFTASQAYYFGAITGAQHHEVVAIDGRFIDLADELDAHAVGKPQKVKAPTEQIHNAPKPRAVTDGDGTAYGLAGLARECEAIRRAAKGHKWETINRAAYSIGGLVGCSQLNQGAAYAALKEAVYALRDDCEDFEHALDTLKTGFEDGMAAPRAAPPQMVRRVTEYFDRPEPPPLDEPPAHLAWEPDPTPSTSTGQTPDGHLKDGPPPFPLAYFQDIKPDLNTRDFVEGLLVEASSAVVYGESNAGKTFFATDLALSIATGDEWFGRQVDQGGVVYCVLEGGFGFRNRLHAWREFNGHSDARHPFAAIQTGINMLRPEADTARLIASIREAAATFEMPVKLVVIDTLARAFAGGNENSSEDMGALVQNMDLVRRETGACVLFIHHSGKDQAKGARGHSSLRAAIDTEIEVVATEAGARTATVVKQRDLPKGDSIAFDLKSIEIGANSRGKPVTTCVVVPSETDPGEVKRAPKLTGGEHAALRALVQALAGNSRPPPDNPDFPRSVRAVVTTQQWRKEFYGRSTLETQEARQKAFVRASAGLSAKGAIGVWQDLVWRVE